MKRRMGVALAYSDTVDDARDRAKACASAVKPVSAQ
jgi:formate-dependent phosphoribosylglycinamide formyltransferase (GAR transformylase)